jgi:hypothetical protein
MRERERERESDGFLCVESGIGFFLCWCCCWCASLEAEWSVVWFLGLGRNRFLLV